MSYIVILPDKTYYIVKTEPAPEKYVPKRILDTYWNYAPIKQLTSRGIRQSCHGDMV